MADVLKVGRKGELTLPRRIRAELRLEEGEELVVSIEGESIVLRRKARRFGAYLEALKPVGGRDQT